MYVTLVLQDQRFGLLAFVWWMELGMSNAEVLLWSRFFKWLNLQFSCFWKREWKTQSSILMFLERISSPVCLALVWNLVYKEPNIIHCVLLLFYHQLKSFHITTKYILQTVLFGGKIWPLDNQKRSPVQLIIQRIFVKKKVSKTPKISMKFFLRNCHI
jgi:hypothetical protein